MTASLSLPHAPAFSQACPPEEEAVPERLWRVHRIPEAVVRVDTGSGVKNAGYFAVPFVSNDLGTLAIVIGSSNTPSSDVPDLAVFRRGVSRNTSRGPDIARDVGRYRRSALGGGLLDPRGLQCVVAERPIRSSIGRGYALLRTPDER